MQSRELEEMYSLQTRGFESARRMLEGAGNKIKDWNKDSLLEIANAIVSEARSNLQNNTNIYSGELHTSIRILSETNDSVTVGTDKPYAVYIEYGRGSVKPINAEFLHWIDKASGKDVFAKFAKATEPMPFLEPAIISKSKPFPRLYSENMDAELQALRTEVAD